MRISDWSSDVCSSDLFRDVDVAGFVRIDAKHRPRAHDDLLDHRSHGPARGPLARAEGIALGLVDHREHDIARIVHRESGGESRDERVAAIAAGPRLFRAARLAADAEAGGVGVAAGAIGDDQAQELAHPRAGRRLEDAAPLRRRLVAELEEGGGTPDAAVDERGIGAREVQRRHRDAMAIAGGHRDRKSTRLNSSHYCAYRMPSSA